MQCNHSIVIASQVQKWSVRGIALEGSLLEISAGSLDALAVQRDNALL
jgi:hypothetical protein